MFVLFIIVFMGILFAISLYLYDNSHFSKITGYSYFTLWTDKKIRYTYKFSQLLNKANGEYKLLFNIVLPKSGEKIDALLIHQSGLYVIDAIQLEGWIYGKEQDVQWAQVLQHDSLNKFKNPIMENNIKMMELKQALPDVNKEHFHSLIVFTNHCSFNKIEIHSNQVDVIKANELKTFWKSETEEKLTKDDIIKIYQSLESYMSFKQGLNNVHLNNVTS